MPRPSPSWGCLKKRGLPDAAFPRRRNPPAAGRKKGTLFFSAGGRRGSRRTRRAIKVPCKKKALANAFCNGTFGGSQQRPKKTESTCTVRRAKCARSLSAVRRRGVPVFFPPGRDARCPGRPDEAGDARCMTSGAAAPQRDSGAAGRRRERSVRRGPGETVRYGGRWDAAGKLTLRPKAAVRFEPRVCHFRLRDARRGYTATCVWRVVLTPPRSGGGAAFSPPLKRVRRLFLFFASLLSFSGLVALSFFSLFLLHSPSYLYG